MKMGLQKVTNKNYYFSNYRGSKKTLIINAWKNIFLLYIILRYNEFKNKLIFKLWMLMHEIWIFKKIKPTYT